MTVKSLLCGSDTLKEYIQNKINQARKDEFLMKLQLLNNADCTSVIFSVNEVMNAISQLTRRPASADRTARAANFRRDLEAT